MNVLDRLRALWSLWGIWDAAEAAARKDPTMDKAKSIFASRIFWFNIAAGIIGFAQSQGLFELVPAPWGPLIVMAGNIVLRLVTSQPVTVLPQ